ncbi:MAG: helix-turn-helix transcriptional regulator [Siculibacillus sp.]|nr:helix-turn-helix transcriptional regulator [Siculibacillus sp.]
MFEKFVRETFVFREGAATDDRERIRAVWNCHVVPHEKADDWRLTVQSYGFGDCRLSVLIGRRVCLRMLVGSADAMLAGAASGRSFVQFLRGAREPAPKTFAFLPLGEVSFDLEGEARFVLVEVRAEALQHWLRAFSGSEDHAAIIANCAMESDLVGLPQFGILINALLNVADGDPSSRAYPLEYVTSMSAIVAGRVAMMLRAAESAESRVRQQRRPSARPGLRACLEFIAENFHEDFDLGQLAARAGMSPRALQLGFRRTLNCTISEYVSQVRLANARASLSDPENRRTVEEIARESGFNHPGYFATSFRKRYGESPRDVVRRARAREVPPDRERRAER